VNLKIVSAIKMF